MQLGSSTWALYNADILALIVSSMISMSRRTLTAARGWHPGATLCAVDKLVSQYTTAKVRNNMLHARPSSEALNRQQLAYVICRGLAGTLGDKSCLTFSCSPLKLYPRRQNEWRDGISVCGADLWRFPCLRYQIDLYYTKHKAAPGMSIMCHIGSCCSN
ncbi:hypothetical protein HDV64DRAFT_11130 [Trichoderma sp. TUCIM 5745]